MSSVFDKVREKLDEATPENVGVRLDDKEVVHVYLKESGENVNSLNLRSLVKATPWEWDDNLPDKIEALVGTIKPLLTIAKNTLKAFKKEEKVDVQEETAQDPS